MKKVVYALAFLFAVSLCACENGNMFSWAHSAGSGDIKSLISDGDSAMSGKNFAKAAVYYKRAMERDPSNSQAIYGYCNASMADILGGTIADIITNFINGGAASVELLPQTILNNTKLPGVLNDICDTRLPKLLSGATDNVIPPDSVDLNVNAALAYLLRAAKTANDGGITIDADFNKSGTLPASSVADLNKSLQCIDTVETAMAGGSLSAQVHDIKLHIQKLL